MSSSDSDVELVLPKDEDLETASGSAEMTEAKIQKTDMKNEKKCVIQASKEELKYRKKNFSEINVENEKLSCTSCAKDLKTYLNLPSLFSTHPILEVLLCKNCSEFYGEGEFSVDEDGTDKYCRWCGQGGTLYLCSECNFGFCRPCIKRNLHRSYLREIDDDDWKCFSCNSKPLWDLRGLCAATMDYAQKKRNTRRRKDKKSHKSKTSRREFSSTEPEEEEEEKDEVRRGSDLKKKRTRDSETSDKRKRKKNDSSSEDTREVKKTKPSSKESLGKKEQKNKYSESLDHEITLDTTRAEKLVSVCKEQFEDILKVLHAILSEVKKVSKEDIVVKNMINYEARKKVIGKIAILKDMSCQSISQACENFLMSYQSGILSFKDDAKEKTIASDLSSLSGETETNVLEEESKDTEGKENVIEKDEPVIEKDEPVIEKDKSVIEKDKPVIEKDKPVIEKDEPVIEKDEPVKNKEVPEDINQSCSNSESESSGHKTIKKKFKKDSTNKSKKSESEKCDQDNEISVKRSKKYEMSSCDDTEMSDTGQQNESVSSPLSEKCDSDNNNKENDKDISDNTKQTKKISTLNCEKDEDCEDSKKLECDKISEDKSSVNHERVNESLCNTEVCNSQQSQLDEILEDDHSTINHLDGDTHRNQNKESDSILKNVTIDENEEKKMKDLSNQVEEILKACNLSDTLEEKGNTPDSKGNEGDSNINTLKCQKSTVEETTECSEKSLKKLKDCEEITGENSEDNSEAEMQSKKKFCKPDKIHKKEQDSSKNSDTVHRKRTLSDHDDHDDCDDPHETDAKKNKRDLCHNEEKKLDTSKSDNGISRNAVISDSDRDIFSDSENEESCIKIPDVTVIDSDAHEEEQLNSVARKSDTDNEAHNKKLVKLTKKLDSSEEAKQANMTGDISHKCVLSNSDEDTEGSGREKVTNEKLMEKYSSGKDVKTNGKSINDKLVDGNDEDKGETSPLVLSKSKPRRNKTNKLIIDNTDSVLNAEDKSKDEKKALMSLLASSSSDEDMVIIRKNKDSEDEEIGESGSHSPKSISSQATVKHDETLQGIFSDASEDVEKNLENDQDLSVKKNGKKQNFSAENFEFKECLIVVTKLPEETAQKYFDKSCTTEERKGENTEKQEIKKLIDLRSLDITAKKKVASLDSDSDNGKEGNIKKRKVLRKHAKKKAKETLKDFHNSDDEQSGQSDPDSSDEKDSKTENTLLNIMEALNKKRNKLAEELLLRSSSSDTDVVHEDEKTKQNEEKKKKKKKGEQVKEESVEGEKKEQNLKKEETDESDGKGKKKKKWRNDKLLHMKLSETDTSDEERKWKNKKEREAKEEEKERKKRGVRRIVNSDSDVTRLSVSSDSDSDDFQIIKKRKHKESSDSNKSSKKNSGSDSDVLLIKKKPKRRRIRKPVSDSDNSDDDEGGVNNSQKSDTTPSKGRKNIRRVIKDDDVAEATRRAAKEEDERRKRMAEKQKLYNSLYNLNETETKTFDKLVLDFDSKTKKELVEVDKNLVAKLKPHQVKGVKFMWDACFESLEHMQDSEGSGCILAHCMGLGKTLQVITLSHTVLKHAETKVKTVLVVCPLSTVLNWVNEYSKWLDLTEDNDIEVFELTKYKQMYERVGVLKHWHENGGVMILGYTLYRILTNPNMKRQRKKNLEILQNTLVDPGPDLIICDEGHLLKNEGSALSKAMNRLKTQRRVVLTGTPLQNNLLEYHCMVQFVKPRLLGTKKEFTNRFVNPINNGQYDNSTAHDVKIMKRRAHVLHKMLDSSVQRFDYSVLTPFLPPKFEYALSIRLTDLQVKLYKYYLENLSFVGCTKNKAARLFRDFQALQRIWTHPRVLLMNSEKQEKKRVLEESDSEGSLRDFVVSSSSDSTSSDSNTEEDSGSDEKQTKPVRKPKTRSGVNNGSDDESVKSTNAELESEKNSNENENDNDKGNSSEWWRHLLADDSQLEDIKQSGKLSLLFTILEECEKIGDKVLVFSQSLFSLDLIEFFLEKIDEANQKNEHSDNIEGHKSSWSLGLDYFRLDGSSSPENRAAWCKSFNRDDNLRARLFLISTRAGGLGINLVAANRVIIFDASWNPSHDLQSIFRVYRFGQKKPCYIYRFLAQHTMEEKIYSRQVTKLSLACRVVDEQQIERHYSLDDLQELYNFNPEEKNSKETPLVPKDVLLAELVKAENSWIDTYHEHDTLLENKEEEELNEEERKAAWEDYEKEKQGLRTSVIQTYDNSAIIAYLNQFGYTEHQIRDRIVRENPGLPEAQVHFQVSGVLRQIFDYVSAEEYRKQIQLQYNKGQMQQPVYFQTPQTHSMLPMQAQVQPQMQPQVQTQMQQRSAQQYVPVMQRSTAVPNEDVQQPYQAHSLQNLLQVPQGNLNQSSDSQPGTSLGIIENAQRRIKVKSFGHMMNSNFQPVPQVLPNPFAAKHSSTVGANSSPVHSTLAQDKTMANLMKQSGGINNSSQQAQKTNNGVTVSDVIDLD